MKIGIKSLQDFAAFLFRRKWWIAVPFVALSCVVAVLTRELPNIYVSEALVQVKPRDVPENFVIDLISRSTEQRLKSIHQLVLSRKNIQAILKDFKDDHLAEYSSLNPDAAIEKLRNQIDIQFGIEPNAAGAREVTSFRLTYQHKDPVAAQEIASRLTRLFIQQDLSERSDHVEGTTTFLEAELKKKELALAESDKALKALKTGHQNELPQQLESNQRILDRLYQEKNSNRETLDRLATNRLNIETLLVGVPEYLPVSVVRAVNPPPPADEPEEKNPELEEYLKAKTALANLKLVNSSRHPDVLQGEAFVERLKARVPPDVLAASEKPKQPKPKPSAAPQQVVDEKRVPNPQWQSLQNTRRLNETETKILLADRSRIEDDINRVTRRVENTPGVELRLSDVQRDNADLRKQSEEISANLTKARLSQSLENNSQGANFVVVDQANLPEEAAKPNKMMVLLGGCLLSLALAIGIALAVDVARQRVWTQAEIESLWGVPVMVDIPAIVTDSDQEGIRRKRLMLAALSVAFVFFYSACLYGVWVNRNPIIQRLDPVLQRVVYR